MYQDYARELLTWLDKEGIGDVKDITRKEVNAYLQHLISRPKQNGNGHLRMSTINHHLFSIQLLFDHLIETEYLDEHIPVPNYLPKKHNPFALITEEEIKDLYKHCQTTTERALLSIGYGCGLRRSEIENLNTADVIYSQGILIVTKGKGNKIREVALNSVVVDDIKKYLSTERIQRVNSTNSSSDAFFLNAKGERLTGDYLNRMLKAIVKRTKNNDLISKKISLHCLRHSITTHLVERGMGIEYIREFLGHKGIDTTSLYMVRRKRRNRYLI